MVFPDGICMKCMSRTNGGICRSCGFNPATYVPNPNALPAASSLAGRYMVGIPLGIGGFGITYIAYDRKIGGVCAIKEYMPNSTAYRASSARAVSVVSEKRPTFDYGLKRFVEEAQTIKAFSSNENIIHVYDSFYDNGTAYYVMEYIDGNDFVRLTRRFSVRLSFDDVVSYFYQTLNGLSEIHRKNFIHRDISPDNLYVTKSGKLKILDFGSTRDALTQRERNLSVIVKYGYAPREQYSAGILQGPWTDIYALCATFYHIVTGIQPEDALDRMTDDELKDAKELNNTLPQYFSDILKKGMSMDKADRYQNVDEIKAVMDKHVKKPTAAKTDGNKSNVSGSEKNANPVNSVNSVNPVNQVNSAKPASPPNPFNSGKPGKPENSAKSAKSANPANSENALMPVKPSKRKKNADANLSEKKPKSKNRSQENVSKPPEITVDADKLTDRRIGAFVIDVVIYAAVTALLCFIIGLLLDSYVYEMNIIGIAITAIITAVLWLFINGSMEASGAGATIGKLLFGIKVVGTGNNPISEKQGIERNALKILSVFLLFTKKDGRFLHERLSSSFVIKK